MIQPVTSLALVCDDCGHRITSYIWTSVEEVERWLDGRAHVHGIAFNGKMRDAAANPTTCDPQRCTQCRSR